MKIKITEAVKDLKGNPIKNSEGNDWTLKEAIATACLSTYQGDNPSGEEKYKRWKLANAVEQHAGEEFEMTVEQVAMVKKLAGGVFPTITSGAIWSMLEK